jgi:hypothetical protein
MPSAPRGPPASVQVARNSLQAAQLEEVSAVTTRDLVRVAKSRAHAAALREWLALARSEPTQLNRLGLSETSTEHLIDLRDKWKNVHDHVSAQRRANPNASVKAALDEAGAPDS